MSGTVGDPRSDLHRLNSTTVPACFETELTKLLNRYSQENDSNTPDFLLAHYLSDCLGAFNAATKARDAWYGIAPVPGTDWRARVAPPDPEAP